MEVGWSWGGGWERNDVAGCVRGVGEMESLREITTRAVV